MNQMNFADAEYAGKRKQTRKELFLIEMDQVVPFWRSAWRGRVSKGVVADLLAIGGVDRNGMGKAGNVSHDTILRGGNECAASKQTAAAESGRARQNGVRATNDRCVDHLPIQHEDAFT